MAADILGVSVADKLGMRLSENSIFEAESSATCSGPACVVLSIYIVVYEVVDMPT